jgi:HEAT repeat protein
MDGVHSKRHLMLLACFAALTAAVFAGCANSGGLASWGPWQKSADEEIPGVVAPHKRIETLREMAKKARWADAQEKQQVSAELAAAIRVEEDPLIRAEIVRTLGQYGSAEGDAMLRAALEDPDADVRVAACEAWGQRGNAEAATLLGGVLSADVDKDVRLAAARALGHTKHPTAVAALGEMLEDSDPAMQVRAVKSLRKITGEDLGNDVNRWRQYVKGQLPQPDNPTSIAERFRRLF